MKTNNNILTLTLAAGDSFFHETEDQIFFYTSLINSKKLFFEKLGIKKNYFLISSKEVSKKLKIKNVMYSKKIINYGSLGSLIYFLNKLDQVPEKLIINYVDKSISKTDFLNLWRSSNNLNTISCTKTKNSISNEGDFFYFDEKKYLFNGFVILDKKMLQRIKKLDKNFYFNNIAYLFNTDIINQKSFKTVENLDKIVEIREKKQIAEIILGSKSKSLDNLKNLKSANIPKFKVLHKSQLKDIESVLNGLDKKLIIRSDSEQEDSFTESNAGKFLSIGPIDKINLDQVKKSVKDVFSSYQNDDDDDKVIIQNYVKNIKSSGVIVTRLLQNSAPYYCISLSESTDSDIVTSGKSNQLKNIYINRNVVQLEGKYKKYTKLLRLIRELEETVNYEYLDIEFAINKNNELFLLQVRPLILKDVSIDNKKELIKGIRKYQQIQNKKKDIYGSKTVLSNMCDWNPAEMLGDSPNYLSQSLYKTFITDFSWHEQRRQFGYRGKIKENLMISFGDRCYIDVRASLNSFLTKSLSDNDCEKIINFQINQLQSNPELHDKVEFEIAETAYRFGIEKKLLNKYKNILDKKVINLWINDLKHLEKSYRKILIKNDLKIKSYYKKLNSNLDFFHINTVNEIRSSMAIPFSHHARLAFIYFSQLNNFVENEILSIKEKQDIMSNLNTVSTNFSDDLLRIKKGTLSYSNFQKIYGHVRPNTYDINSKSISEKGNDFVDFLLENIDNKNVKNSEDYDLSIILKKIDEYLIKRNYSLDANEWFEMFQNSITARENSKFLYSKAVDLTLNQIKESKEINRTDKQNLDFSHLVKENKPKFTKNLPKLELPDAIFSSNDFLFYENFNTKPNYIGDKVIKGNIQLAGEGSNHLLNSKIVILPNADPGWDWVFNLPIIGLVTKYGGPNSHMAIRAAEKNITSVFGVGDELFIKISDSKFIEIDPISKKLYFK